MAAPTLAASLAGALAVLVGALVLVGWTLDITALKSVLPGWVSMKPNTALCFILTGLALLPTPLTQNPGRTSVISNLTRLCGLLAGLIGLLTLGESIFSWDFGIDQLLFPEPAGTVGTSVPGRMAPETALCFVSLATAREILRNRHKTRKTLLAAVILCALVLVIALSDILTYFTPELGAFGWWGATIMAVPTAAVFAVLGASMLWLASREDALKWMLSVKVTAGFALGLLVLVVVGLTASRLQVLLQDTNKQTAQADTVLRQLARVEAEVADAQNYTRGYLLVGNEQMLRSHASAEASANEALSGLRQSIPDVAPERARFAQVEAQAKEALQWFRRVIDAHRTGLGVPPAQVLHGEELMQALRASIGEAERTQGARPRQSRPESQSVSQFAYAVIAGGVVLSLIVLVSALVGMNYAEHERIRSQAQLEVTQRAKAAGLYARSLIEASLDPLVTISTEGKITDVNAATEQVTGLDRVNLIGSDFADYFTDPEQARASYQQVFSKGFVKDYPLAIRHVSGSITDVLYNASIYRDDQGRVLGVFAAARDITERKKAEESIQAASVFTHAREGIMIVAADGTIMNINDAFTRITGYSREEVVGKPPHLLSSELQSKEFYETMWSSLIEQGYWSGEIWDRRKNGELFATLQTISAVRDTRGHTKQYVALFSDITARNQLEQEVQQLAFHDPLTQLANRRLLYDRLAHTMATSKRSRCYGALLFLDLDNFKSLNDEHGHTFGDLLLIEAAKRLKSCVREIDTVSRFGGDEFVVLLNELTVDQAESTLHAKTVAEKIRVTLAQPYRLTSPQGGNTDTTVEHHCTASIGAVVFIDHEASQDDLFRRADTAMYQAKAAGRNQARFYALNEQASTTKTSETGSQPGG